MASVNPQVDDGFGVRATFSLSLLFRATAIIAFLIAWPVSMATSPPDVLAATLVGIGIVLATIVGHRRHGAGRVRIATASRFLAGVLLIALYSACAASALQSVPPQEPRHPFDEIPSAVMAIALVLLLPVMLGIMVLLLRAWTWSAHDLTIRLADERRATEQATR